MTRHKQADMLIAIAEDSSLADKVQWLNYISGEYERVDAEDLITAPEYTYRFEPREFKDGWWYPVVTKYDKASYIMQYKDEYFYLGLVRFKEKDLIIGEGFEVEFPNE